LTFAEFFTSIPAISIILFVVGIILMAVELSIPGFGIAGISSIISLVLAILLASKSLAQGMVLVAATAVVVILMIALFFAFLSKGRMSSKLVLKDETSLEEGFSSSADMSFLIGKAGKAETTLRPAGRIVIDQKPYDVITRGEFISPGETIVVVEVTGNRIVVAEASNVLS